MFEARVVGPDAARVAYAVALLACPELALSDFRRRMGGRLHGRSGALVGVFDRRGYVHALCQARAERQLTTRRRLRLFDLLHSDSRSAQELVMMIEALERFTRQAGCDEMTIEAVRGSGVCAGALGDVLRIRGFSGETMLLARQL